MSLPSMIPFNDNGDEVTGEVVKGAGNLTMGGRAPWAEGQRTWRICLANGDMYKPAHSDFLENMHIIILSINAIMYRYIHNYT